MIGGLAPASAYPAMEPWPTGPLIVPIGDMHQGKVSGSNAWQANLVKTQAHLTRRATPPVIVQIGDFINGNSDGPTQTQQTADAKTFFAALPGSVKRVLVGNHDYRYGQTGTAAMAAYGYNALNWTYDPGTGYPLLVGISPEADLQADQTTIDLTNQLAWLDATLAAATKDVYIFCHAPLEDDTANLDTFAGGWSGQWCAQPTASVLAVLAAHTNAKAWISGHTHTDPFLSNRFADPYTLPGGRRIAQINVSALAYVNPTDDAWDPARLFPISPLAGAAGVRILDCGAGAFMPWPDGNLVRSVAFD